MIRKTVHLWESLSEIQGFFKDYKYIMLRNQNDNGKHKVKDEVSS